ncbi:four helix bundle protein [Calditrichota bacterium GD2]
MNNLKSFKSLNVWKKAQVLKLKSYELCKQFPSDEKFILVSQIKRAAISITANIAEGFGRYSYRDNFRFCIQARGSLYELYDHFTTALELGYITKEAYYEIEELFHSTAAVLNGYIGYLKLRAEGIR